MQAALSSWLDSESSYRLTVEKAKEATDGADYARQQYEKYNTAYLDAKKTLDSINDQNADERNGLVDERDLIKQIMVMIGERIARNIPVLNRIGTDSNPIAAAAGVLNDQEATDKDIAAGGKNSVKNEYGVSDPYAIGAKKAISTTELMHKLEKLQSLSRKVPTDLSLRSLRSRSSSPPPMLPIP